MTKELEIVNKALEMAEYYKLQTANVKIEDLKEVQKVLEVLDIIKRAARKNLEAGKYINYDNPCLMIKDYEGKVVDWHTIDEADIDKVNEVLKND